MITVRGCTRRFLNAVMALHRRAVLREVQYAKAGLELANRRTAYQERVIKAEKDRLWELRSEALDATLHASKVEQAATVELASLTPRV